MKLSIASFKYQGWKHPMSYMEHEETNNIQLIQIVTTTWSLKSSSASSRHLLTAHVPEHLAQAAVDVAP